MIEIPFEGFAARCSDVVFRKRCSAREGLLHRDVTGVFELTRVDADVAVSSVQEILQVRKAEFLVCGKSADDAKPHSLVDHLVKFARDGFGGVLNPKRVRIITAAVLYFNS